jgi:hypothetical protein
MAWLREPGADLDLRAQRADLAEEVEMGRPGRMRDLVLDAIRWNRAVIIGELADGDASWVNFDKTVTDAPPNPAVVDEATVAPDGTVVDEATVGPVPGLAGTSDGEGDPETADPGSYTATDVPKNAADVVAWIQGAADETDAAARSQAAWLVEIDRSQGVRATVRTEIDKHLA